MHAVRVLTFQETFQIEITKSYGMNAGCSGALLICDEKLDLCILRGEFTQFLRSDVRRNMIQIHSNPLKSQVGCFCPSPARHQGLARRHQATADSLWWSGQRGADSRNACSFTNDANGNGDETSNKRQLNHIKSS